MIYLPIKDKEGRRAERGWEEETREDKKEEDEEMGGSTQQNRKRPTKQRKHKVDETELSKGHMHSHVEPRQPKETQQNKTGTLRYEKETETWHWTKCDKNYPKQNARSAKSHAIAHTHE